MLGRHMNVRAANGALHDGPKAFDGVRVVDAAHVFLRRVIDRDVAVSAPVKIAVGGVFVRGDDGARRDVREHHGLKRYLFRVRHYLRGDYNLDKTGATC